MVFLVGLVMLVVGALITVKANKVLEILGPSEFFETKLGSSGGSRLGYQLLGIALAFLGILAMTGLIQGFTGWILSPLLKVSVPQ